MTSKVPRQEPGTLLVMNTDTPHPSRIARRSRDEWLIRYRNPLTDCLGLEFFRTLPESPGIYRMIGQDGSLLYVGKSLNLRDRVNSYRQARPGQVPRKTLRLISQVVRIEIEETPSEEAALLLENKLLRQLKPPFNRQNTTPESYLFLGLKKLQTQGQL